MTEGNVTKNQHSLWRKHLIFLDKFFSRFIADVIKGVNGTFS
jgi:hypothetical protein